MYDLRQTFKMKTKKIFLHPDDDDDRKFTIHGTVITQSSVDVDGARVCVGGGRGGGEDEDEKDGSFQVAGRWRAFPTHVSTCCAQLWTVRAEVANATHPAMTPRITSRRVVSLTGFSSDPHIAKAGQARKAVVDWNGLDRRSATPR